MNQLTGMRHRQAREHRKFGHRVAIAAASASVDTSTTVWPLTLMHSRMVALRLELPAKSPQPNALTRCGRADRQASLRGIGVRSISFKNYLSRIANAAICKLNSLRVMGSKRRVR
jgi:hypothetical protein